ARASNRTAIFLGLQNPMPMEDDIGLIEMLFDLGIRFMQLTYNNQSLLGCGWMEKEDSGVTRMGREAIAEMNRLGMIIDLSHAGERTALEAIALSERPVVISHANPRWLRDSNRNVSKHVLQALREREGLL
ncbi:MAG: membrane dipeptidase, partial [Mesorhizobium sp.]